MSISTSHVTVVSDTVFVLDLDRCLITERAYSLLNGVVEDLNEINLDHLLDARRKNEETGGSFDVINWLQTDCGFGPERVQDLLEKYIAAAHRLEKDALLAPGARTLLTTLKTNGIPYFIMTYGGYLYQRAKIVAAGLEDISYIVVDHKHKGRIISNWYSSNSKQFTIPVGPVATQASHIVLVDDKAGAFDELPPASLARGYWVRGETLLSSQQGNVPDNVVTINRLDDILVYEPSLQ